MSTPPGFVRVERGRATLLVRADLEAELLAAGVEEPRAVIEQRPAGLGGRAALGRIDLGGRPALVRALTRGGLLGRVVRRASLDPERAFNELRVGEGARARGARVLEVVAAITRQVSGGYEHGLVSLELEGARDLVGLLRAEPEGPGRWRGVRAAGEAIAGLHAAGVDHVDLNLKNVLVTREGAGVVIDLDRCTQKEGPTDSAVRERNLMRLYRSWVKLRTAEPQSVSPRDPLRLVHAYGGADRSLKRQLVDRGLATSFASHRLRWALFPPRFA